jgi:metallo-beta-lactamase family protein
MGEVRFVGACGTVTGSCTLLRWGGFRLLVDCGLYQGDEETEALNWQPFPFAAREIDAVVLTHAHLDHCGLLPKLASEGFTGPVHASRPTRALASLVLRDAAELQEEEARFARKKGYSRHAEPRALFGPRDAKRALALFEPLPFEQEREVAPGISIRLHRAGHLLGAASVEVSAKGSDGKRRRWLFSGDVGRYDVPILRDPVPPAAVPAAVLLESTYGNRLHAPEPPVEGLRTVIARTFARGGSVVIPAFALGRTQDVLYYLSTLADEGFLDPNVVYVDSPMAIEATEIYRRAASEFDADLEALARNGVNPLAPDRFQRCRSSEQSRELNGRTDSLVIVAASGMAVGGRVVHHLKHRLPDPRNTILFAGYQAAGTRGRAILDGADTVAIHGHQIRVAAEILSLPGLSAHADRAELVRWCQALPAPPARLFLNHGEDPARKALAVALAAEPGWPRAVLPLRGQSVPW